MNELIRLVSQFNEVRDWRKFHDPRSLVLALCGEIGELAQLFRWCTASGRKLSISKRKAVEGEIADILIFLLSLCVELDINPEQVLKDKIKENEKRFPVKGKEAK